MAKPPKKIPRPSSAQTPTTSTHPMPDAQGTSAGDSGQSAASLFPDTHATRPPVTISEPPAADTSSSMARAADSLQQHAVGTEPLASGNSSTSEGSSETVFINPEFATQLKRKRGDEEGFLYDKRNKPYVELHAGIVMVGRTADGWRQTYAGESMPTGKTVEQIPGSTLWRERASVSPVSRQPLWARKRDGVWQVLDGYPPFEMSATQYVATAFRHLSQRSSSNLARAVFDRASLPTGINGDGLSVVSLTYRHWLDRVNNVAPGFGLAEPLLMLPKLPTAAGSTAGAGLLALPDYHASLLQRLDFDPSKFSARWAAYAAQPTALNLRTLFIDLLQDNGYSVAPPVTMLVENTLVFHRPDIAGLFILKLPLVSGDQVPRYTTPGSNFDNPDFLASLSAENKRHLEQYLSQVEVAHLVGGVQRLSAETQTLFIVREG